MSHFVDAALRTKYDLADAANRLNNLSRLYPQKLHEIVFNDEQLSFDNSDHRRLMEDLVLSLTHEKTFTYMPLDRLANPTERKTLLTAVVTFYLGQETLKLNQETYSFFLTLSPIAVYRITVDFTGEGSIISAQMPQQG